HRLVARPDSVLVAHRAERRAVVRVHGPHYVKVVRPERTADVVAPLRQVRADGLRVPRVLDADERRGLVTLSEVAGPTLLERLADRTLDDEELATDAKRVGVAVRALHEHPAGPAREVHGPDAEVASARRWLDAASEHGLLDPSAWRDRLDDVAARLPAVPDEPALLHRDLHDKQLVLQPDEPVGLLDLDLAAYGDPALDLSNLLVHLDLRARQGLCTEARAAQCSLSLLEGYSPDAALLRRLPAYAAGTRLRLAGVYSFRAAPAGLVDELIRKVDEVGSSWL
ncbi:MAG: phosphotransferase, partial [Nocardioidaceae bacterium]|nr:phosphotransferase [Nocardioidaceae bacterium]